MVIISHFPSSKPLKILLYSYTQVIFFFLFFFNTTGGYHFEIDDGKVRWFHRNRNQIPVFSAITDDIVRPDVWTHFIGSYNSTTLDAKVTRLLFKNRIRVRISTSSHKTSIVHSSNVIRVQIFFPIPVYHYDIRAFFKRVSKVITLVLVRLRILR